MLRVVSGLLSVFVGSMVAIALAGTGVSSAHAPATKSTTSADGQQVMVSIRKLSPYVVARPDGTLSLAAPAKVLATVPSRDLTVLQLSLASANTRILNGSVVATTGGVLLTPGYNPLILSDGSTYHAYYWWGQSWCFSHADLYNGFVLGTEGVMLLLASAISGIVGLSVGYLEWELLVVDYWGGNNGACINLINSQFVTFTPQ